MASTVKINKASYWLMELGTEVEDILTSTIGEKYKIMLLMTYIDIFSKIWGVHIENTSKNQKDKFQLWSDKFVFNDLNSKFVNQKNEILPLNSEFLYEIRNSLIHFSALPNIDNIYMFISSDSKSEFCNRYPDKTKGKEDQILLLTPKILFILIIKAIILTIHELGNNATTYEATLLKIAEKLQKESAMRIYNNCQRNPIFDYVKNNN